MADLHMAEKLMAALKELADARAAGHVAAAQWAEQELDRLMELDPVTSEQLMNWLDSERQGHGQSESTQERST